MKLSVATKDDPFIRHKCMACKRTVKSGEAVFSRFMDALPRTAPWMLVHLKCLQCSEPLTEVISGLAPDVDAKAYGKYHALRQQILETKEAFPDAAA